MARPPYNLFQVSAEHVALVTPHMKRISIDGSCLSAFRAELPAQWLKVFVPAGEGDAVTGRAYTVRRFDPVSKQLDLDFVLHGDDGPASAWAARVKRGDIFKISATHPRSGFAINPETARYLLLGDETALPAIGAILESLPAHAHANAFVEVADVHDEQTIESAATVNLTWLHRKAASTDGASKLESVAKTIGRPDENTVVWIAAESSVVKSLRKHASLEWGLDRQHLHAAGYWKRGESDHRDDEAPE